MAQEIRLAKLSPTMETGTVVRWLKKEGDTVASGDALCEVETDKATMPQEAFEDGTLLKILAAEGQTVPVDAPIAVLGAAGEDVSAYKPTAAAALAKGAAKAPPPAPAEKKPAAAPPSPPAPEAKLPAASATQPAESPAPAGASERLKASPLAKKLAQERGVDLRAVTPSGPGGRIVERDVPAGPAAPLRAPVAVEIPLSNLRQTIARRLVQSKQTVPHFYLHTTVSAGRLVSLREDLNGALPPGSLKISFNDLVIKAAALALTVHPEVNASFQETVIRQHGEVHIAVAVATDAGLYTPVLHNVDRLTLSGIAFGVRELAERARTRSLRSEDLAGAGFTVTNLGMYGIDHFYAIINPPEAAVLAVGAIRTQAVVNAAGAVVAGQVMELTLSCDHRVIDGATGAKFLGTVKEILEHPARMGQF